MAPSKKRCGVGAKCTVLTKYMHPAKLIDEKYPNRTAHHKVENLVAIREDTKKVSQREQCVFVFRHDDFPDKELHCVRRWCKVIEEGAEEHLFERIAQQRVREAQVAGNEGRDEEATDIGEEIFRMGNRAEDIAMVRAAGFVVDDDNDPLPENIPPLTIEDQAQQQHDWGWSGLDERKNMGAQNVRPSIVGLSSNSMACMSYVGMFFMFFPRAFIENVMIGGINKRIENHVTLGEFLRWLGIWLLLATMNGFSRVEFWSEKPIDRRNGAPYRFNDLMSGRRFSEILTNLCYTDRQAPSFRDRFWEVRQIVQEWNKWMAENFVPSWINCLDESMSIWTNRWTCPGWVFCPRKPHPFGNEYHSICCCLSGIMYRVEMVEGKDHPREMCAHPSDDKGKTIGLLRRLTKPLYSTGKVVVLDSGFCVLEGLIELRKKGVFAGALIKKRRYWPKHVPGDDIDLHFEDKEVGSTDALRGVIDNVPYNIFCMKEPDYTMKIMATYSGLTELDNQKESVRHFKGADGGDKVVRFKYAEPFANHFLYRHEVDDHNNLRHAVPSIEGSWITRRWANRVFAFLLAVNEVNVYLAFKYFVWSAEDCPKLLTFRKNLAWAFIYNDYLDAEVVEVRKSKRAKVQRHSLASAPPGARKYLGGKWDCSAKKTYQQYTCKTIGCQKLIRTYCTCSIGHWMCKDCHLNHIAECCSQAV